MESKKPPRSALVDDYVVNPPSLPSLSRHLGRYLGGFRLTPPTHLAADAQVPGDVILDLADMTNQTVKLGAGLRQVKHQLF